MTTTNKLPVNHELINTNFQSYRYNRDVQCTVLAGRLPSAGSSKVHTFKLGSSDYSYCHAAMSSGINSLYSDRHDASKVYLISEEGEVLTPVLLSTQTDNRQLDLKTVFTIPDFSSKSMNASLSFPSESKAIVLLSSRQSLQKVNVQVPGDQLVPLERNHHQLKMFILKRNPEQVSETWDVESLLDIPRSWLYSDLNIIDSSHSHLFDSTLPDSTTLRLVIGSVYECFQLDAGAKNDKNKVKSRFGAIFHQIQLHSSPLDESPKWAITKNNRFVDDARTSNDFPKYASLGNNNDIVFVSNFRMKYKRIDSALLDSKDTSSTDDDDDDDALLIAAEELNKEPTVDEDTLREVERSEREAIKEAKFTKAVFDEYESCDMQDSASSLVMTSFDLHSGTVLQEYDLSAQQWLFSMTNYSPVNRLPFFVTRHDVDAFIYEPQSIMSTSDQTAAADQQKCSLSVQHIDSFPAFGYVFASKQNRRFVTFCQKVNSGSSKTVFKSAVIDNWVDQLLYVYSRPIDQASPTTGQQFLFYFNPNEEPKSQQTERTVISGLCALPSLVNESIDGKSAAELLNQEGAIYVLTEDTLYLIQF